MAENLTTADKMRRLPWYFVGHLGNGAFVSLTVFGALFVLFLNELGLDKSRIGFLLSLLPFTGILAPFIGGVAERIGLKRLCLFGFGCRPIIILFLLATPWVLDNYDEQTAFRWVAGIILVFSIVRIVGLTGIAPWSQEFIPDHIRGKVAAITLLV